MSEQVEIAGRLSRGTVAASSKSEHTALVVAADDGRVLVVRRRGAPAFGDDETSSGSDLASLEGRRVRLVGTLVAGTVLADAWSALD